MVADHRAVLRWVSQVASASASDTESGLNMSLADAPTGPSDSRQGPSTATLAASSAKSSASARHTRRAVATRPGRFASR